MRKPTLVLAVLVLAAGGAIFLSQPPASAQFGGGIINGTTGGSGDTVSASDILGVVADAGTLARADQDLYANTFIASSVAPDGGPGVYGYICNQSPCTTKFGAGTQEQLTASNNTLTFSAGDIVMATVHITQPANTTGNTVRWFTDTGQFFGFWPSTDTTGCTAGKAGGMRFNVTDGHFKGCDGTTLQTLAYHEEWSASLNFAVFATVGCQVLTFTATGAVKDEAVAAGGCGTVVTGDDQLSCTVAAGATDRVDVQLCCHNAAGCADLAAITFSAAALR